MKNKLNVFLIILILLSGLSLSLYYINVGKEAKVDVSELNNVVKSVQEKWGSNSFKFPKEKFKFKIIDINGNVKYSNYKTANEDYDSQIVNSVKNRDTILDVIYKNDLAGKVIVLNDTSQLKAIKANVTNIVICIFLLLTVICTAYLLYLNFYFYRPFKKLQKFAGRIAEGNLDIPLEIDRNNVFGAFTESFDIMREQLKISRQNEYLANCSKKELIASLSHDIKTPIASIKAICELLEVKLSNKDETKKIHIIFEKADHIEKLINDMFQSTLDELQELKVEPDIYESRLINNFIKDNDYYGKIKFINSCPECLIFVDKIRIRQVIDNIINNSYKYADTCIEIIYELQETHLIVYFKDFGNGVDEDELEMIFNKFYRGSNSKGITGSGLGLYLSQYFMQNMKGEIECYNEKDGFVSKIYIKLS